MPVSQAGGAGDSQYNYVRLVELGVILCCHRKPGSISLGQEIVQDRGSCPDPAGWTRGDPEPQCAQRTSGAWRVHGSCTWAVTLSTDMGNQEGCVDHCVSIHSEWNGDGVSVIEICPLTTLRNRYPRSPSTLLCIQCHIINMPHIRFQKGLPRHNL